MTSARASAIAAINTYKSNGQAWNFRETPTSEIFGSNVFSDSVMKDRLPKSVYKALQATIKQGKPIDPGIADAVALLDRRLQRLVDALRQAVLHHRIAEDVRAEEFARGRLAEIPGLTVRLVRIDGCDCTGTHAGHGDVLLQFGRKECAVQGGTSGLAHRRQKKNSAVLADRPGLTCKVAARQGPFKGPRMGRRSPRCGGP